MKLNINRINKIFDKYNTKIIAIRDSLNSREIFNKSKKIGLLYLGDLRELANLATESKMIIYILREGSKLYLDIGDSEVYFDHWKYFSNSKYSNKLYTNNLSCTYYLIDYKDLFNDNEELE